MMSDEKQSNKITKRSPVDFYFNWGFRMSIAKLREDLDELEELGATHVDIETEISFGDPELKIQAIHERLETDEEYTKRLKEEKTGGYF